MTTTSPLTSVVPKLKATLTLTKSDKDIQAVLAAKDEVLAQYQQTFAPGHLHDLTKEEFRGFLLFDNNKHWTGLARQGTALLADMPKVQEALMILLDETQPLKERLDKLMPKGGSPFMPKFGKALITAILHVTHPDKYGVYNGTSEAGMKAVGAFPAFERGASFSERYMAVNDVLIELAQELQVDLWTLDALWWRVKSADGEIVESLDALPDDDMGAAKAFGLERHLHNFMFDNWEKLDLAKEWDLYKEDEEIVGYEYNTNEIGKIDLLAQHKTEPRWLVIELKRQQSSDDTVGQVLRYMGWVKENLATDGKTVEGLIIARQADPRIKYALMSTRNVGLMCYRVEFYLDTVRDGSDE